MSFWIARHNGRGGESINWIYIVDFHPLKSVKYWILNLFTSMNLHNLGSYNPGGKSGFPITGVIVDNDDFIILDLIAQAIL